VRGERDRLNGIRWTQLVSIRAPRAGRKSKRFRALASRMTFQSAPRVRGESPDGACGGSATSVSIRAPRAGRKVKTAAKPVTLVVSIRAPRAGRKGEDSSICHLKFDRFNPRPACGAKADSAQVFAGITTVSIRAPRAGRKPTLIVRWLSDRCFNPRPACGAKARKAATATAHASRFNPRPACGAKAVFEESF